jgi:hypothetical protein
MATAKKTTSKKAAPKKATVKTVSKGTTKKTKAVAACCRTAGQRLLK